MYFICLSTKLRWLASCDEYMLRVRYWSLSVIFISSFRASIPWSESKNVFVREFIMSVRLKLFSRDYVLIFIVSYLL